MKKTAFVALLLACLFLLASCADEIVYVPDKEGIVVDERSRVYQDEWEKEYQDDPNAEIDHAASESRSMTDRNAIELPFVELEP